MMEKLLTIQQVMDLLQVSDEAVYRWIVSGKLKAFKAGALWRIRREDLNQFLIAYSAEPAEPKNKQEE